MRSAIAALLLAACTPTAPTGAPVLAAIDAREARCRTAGGGPGVLLDSACVAIVMHAGGWDRTPPAPGDPEIARAAERIAAGRECAAAGAGAIGDGAVFLHVLCFDAAGTPLSYLARVEPTGRVTSLAVPRASTAQLAFVPGPRPLVIAVLTDTGTIVVDPRTLTQLAGWQRMGGWFNATSYGPAASPDAAWIAVPDPYGERVDIIRTADLAVAASLRVGEIVARDEGPGRVVWSAAGLEITSFRLPYE